MKVGYIAGPFRDKNAWLVEQNIHKAEEAMYLLSSLGASIICPHSNTRFFDGTFTGSFWLASTMELLRRSDFVFLLPDWTRSVGATAEREEALKLGITVFTTYQEVESFLGTKNALSKKELLKRLASYAKWKGTEDAHRHADKALLRYINDPEVTLAYEKIDKWYS